MCTPLSVLRSDRSTKRLEQIASLRARGIGEHVNLPQLVVCGDQSAGKSSVLEGVTGLPFPRQDGLCTKFATEIILTHDEGEMTTNAEIIPGASRSEVSKHELANYKRTLHDFSELPDVIAETGSLMGIRGFGNADGPAFGQDVLRIKVSGLIGLHLTIVDLPGLISVPNEEQNDDDVQTVHSLVDSYLSNPRTIILAVVQAGNDIANQPIIQKSKKFDRSGQRTIGIITKPDLINVGSEGRIAMLAKNQDTTKLKLGFFLVKNPTPSELDAGVTQTEREQKENRYFSESPWREQHLDMDRVGIVKLRGYLQRLLDHHMERELPKVRDEIVGLMTKTETEIASLGEERPTPSHRRMFLSRLAMRFHTLTSAALHGDYHTSDASFFAQGDEDTIFLRLRAFVHNVNAEFAQDMLMYGATLKVVSGWDTPPPPFESSSDSEPQKAVKEEPPQDILKTSQTRVTENEMKAFVMKIYRRTRGRELPGNYNHVLLTELFHHQSKRWKEFANVHLSHVAEQLTRFMNEAVNYLCADEQIRGEMLDRIGLSMTIALKKAEEELDRICQDKDEQPITYNHYYTDNVQNSRHETTRNLIKKALDEVSDQDYNKKLHISNTTVDAEKLLGALQRRVLIDMDEQACSEALAGLNAYYKVARKTFVDNICIQVVERHLLRNLPSVFSPETVAGLSDDELEQIASEGYAATLKRKQLQNLHESLVASLNDLKRG